MAASPDRGGLLTMSDNLLERIEQLRLQGLLRLPATLRHDLVQLADNVRGDEAEWVPRTTARAHHYVFDLQSALLNLRRWNASRRRGGGVANTRTGPGLRRLELPVRGEVGSEIAWAEAIRLTVRRANDRWSLLDAQAVATARLAPMERARLGRLRAAQAEAARNNLDELRDEATRLLGVTPESRPLPVLRSVRLRRADLLIDLTEGHVRRGSERVEMTWMERQLLAALAENPGRVLSKEALVHMLHGDDPRVDLRSRAIDVHLAHVRRKLGESAEIETLPQLGYRWVSRDIVAGKPALAPERHRIMRARSIASAVQYDYTQQWRPGPEVERGR
jgi:DNA-binding winged helix-turn-helix (wHTH) protein